MNNEDKKMQKQLVDEMMKVSKTNPDVMIYMQALMENYEKLEKKLDQYKNNWEELKKYVKESFKDTMTYVDGIFYENKPIYEEILNKMKELEEE